MIISRRKFQTAIGRKVSLSFSEMLMSYFGNGLIAYWKMNEASGNLIDSSGNNFTAVYGGAGVTYQTETLPNGDKMLTLNGAATANFTFYSAAFRDAFNFNQGTISVIVKVANWITDGGYLVNFRGDGGTIINIQKPAGGGISTSRVSGGYFTESGHSDFVLLTTTWDTSTGLQKFYANGRRCILTIGGQTNVTDVLITNYSRIGSFSAAGMGGWIGSAGHLAVGTTVLTDTQIKNLYTKMFEPTRGLFIVGDSKSTGYSYWPGYVCNGLSTALGGRWIEKPTRFSVGGYDIGEIKTYIDANLSSVTDIPEKIIMNVGANDIVEPTPEAQFKSEYTSVVNSLRSKFPGVPIYIAKVWRGDSAQNIINSGTINGYIDWIAAQYPSGVTLGLNEAITLENGDSGVTYYGADKVHPNAASQSVQADAWLQAMGY